MLTAAYQRSTIYSPTNYEVDPDNRLYWRANRRRLDAEAIRDTLLFVSGNLDPTLGGPSLEITDVKNNRRTVYSRVSRFRLDDYLQTFDFANPSLTVGKRFATSVPQQSLYFMNSQMVERQSQNLVNRLEGKPPFEAPDEAQKVRSAQKPAPAAEVGSASASATVAGVGSASDTAKITLAYNYVYGRSPSVDEIDLGQAFLAASREAAPDDARTPWAQYARVLFAANELRFID